MTSRENSLELPRVIRDSLNDDLPIFTEHEISLRKNESNKKHADGSDGSKSPTHGRRKTNFGLRKSNMGSPPKYE